MFATCRASVGVVMLVAGVVSAAAAQQTGALNGTVRDAQGGVLPGVTVTAVERDDGAALGRDERAGRRIRCRACRPAPTAVTFELAGFSRAEA